MKKETGWLYLPVEIKVRELDAKLLLAYYAVKEGYHVIIGEHKMVELASTVYPKGIFFSKGYPRGFRRRIITNAKDHGHQVVELDEEGLLINDKSLYLRDRMKQDMLHLVTQEYCWGDFQKQVITTAYPGDEKKLHLVGSPRFDLLAPKFNGIYKNDANKLRNIYGEFVLINTRFSIYNSVKGLKSDNIDSMTMYFKKLYDSFVETIIAMCREFPAVNLVLRPHPGENVESYRSAFSSCNNVHIIHEGNIIKWLMAAEVVIHNGCTSSIEAFLLKKPIISYQPITSYLYDLNVPNELGIKVTNTREVLKLLKNLLSNNENSKNEYKETMDQKMEILGRFYHYPKENFSYETILRSINSIALPETKKILPLQSKNLYLKESKQVKYFFPSLIEEEITEFFMKIDQIENNSSNISINRLGRNLFELKEI